MPWTLRILDHPWFEFIFHMIVFALALYVTMWVGRGQETWVILCAVLLGFCATWIAVFWDFFNDDRTQGNPIDWKWTFFTSFLTTVFT